MKRPFVTVLALGALGCDTRSDPARGSVPRPPVATSDAGWEGQRPSPPRPRLDAGAASEAPDDASDGRTPSGYFLVSKERLATLRAGRTGAAWSALLANAEEALVKPDRTQSSPENVALAYLVTGDKRFAAGAYRFFKANTSVDVRDGSYLGFGDLLRGAAYVLNYCGDALTPAERAEIIAYLERWTNELWFANKGSGWGLEDAGNNYYCAFVEGTAHAAFALEAAKHPSAKKLVDLTRAKIEGPKGSLAYLAGQGRGGDWHEGANYGQRSKQRLFSAFAAIASMGGPNYFARTPFTREAILYALYQLQPGRRSLAPTGDLARDVAMDVSPFDRDYIQLATYWVDDPAVRALGAWYLTEVAPSYLTPRLNVRDSLYRDVVFPRFRPVESPAKLPLGYRSSGTEWLNARSSWDDGATSLTVVASPEITQSHAHVESGGFVLWRGGWQIADAGTFGKSGLNWEAGAHNMINVAGHDNTSHKSGGLVQYADAGGVMYAQIDSSKLFVKRVAGGDYEDMLDEWTRELVFVRPDALAVYDRVVAKPLGKSWSWRVHTPGKPSGDKARFFATHGDGAVSIDVLDGGEVKVQKDTDLIDGGSTAWRVEVGPNATGRVLSLLRTGARGAPAPPPAEAIAAPGVAGVASSSHVIVFSSAPLGRPAALPFSYKVKDGPKRQHVLANMRGGCDVDVSRAGGTVTVRVSPGTKYRATEQGLVRFSD
ncbi:MAG: heparinase II/III family protein [Labilithrix sp.]|nr:heparinase II/III family protein [Labilithrix sp.]